MNEAPTISIETPIGPLTVVGHRPDLLSVRADEVTVNRIPWRLNMDVVPHASEAGARLNSGYGIHRVDKADFLGETLSWNARAKLTGAVLEAAKQAFANDLFMKQAAIYEKCDRREALRREAVELERKAAENLAARTAINLELEELINS